VTFHTEDLNLTEADTILVVEGFYRGVASVDGPGIEITGSDPVAVTPAN
jgi:hypothetical protein